MSIKIGLVDDHRLFLDGLISLFSRENDFHIIFASNNTSSALNYLEQNDINLLITDISMPGVNGIEFIKIVKQKHPNIKILILSMFEGAIPHKQVNGYIKKESLVDELVDAIKQIMKGNNYFQGMDEKLFTLEFNKNIVTTREKEIIRLIALGLSVTEIADQLYLSKGTIETHKKNIYVKLNVNTAPEIVKKAMLLGIIKF